MTPRIIPIEQRFWAKVQKSDGCWLWTASVDRHGYGLIGKPGKHGGHMAAHQLAWQLANGPIPAGLWVLHHCDNPPCVRPEHLFLGTRSDNMIDASTKGRLNFQIKPALRPQGERHHLAKLTLDRVRELIARNAAGETNKSALAREFGVSHKAIANVLQGKSWGEALRESEVPE